MEKIDVLICGAGPVGLSLAIVCAQHGISCAVIEKMASKPPYSKALAIWSNTLEAFETMGVVEEVLSRGIPLQQIQWGFGKKGTSFLSLKVDSQYSYPIILPQYETEDILRKRLEALGVKVLYGKELTSFQETADGIEAFLHEEKIEASWLVGADGAHSVVRHLMGVSFEGYAEKETFCLADVKTAGDLHPNTLTLVSHRSSLVAFFPLPEGLWRVVAKKSANEKKDEPTLSEVQEILDREGIDVALSSACWLSYFSVNERLASHFSKGRVFLIGDAAHIHSPAGGQGMNTGIQDACNLGWKFKYFDSQAVRDSYEAERRPIAHQMVRSTAFKQHVAAGSNIFLRLIKRLIPLFIPLMARKLARSLSGLDLCYRKSPLVVSSGKRFEGKRSLSHQLFTDRPELFDFLPFGFERIFSSERRGSWCLVRPDGYIAAEGRNDQVKLLKKYLACLKKSFP